VSTPPRASCSWTISIATLSFPLKQIVKHSTRRSSILDKIYTNVDKWYTQPAILPPVGNSDHNAVLHVPVPRANVKHAITPRAYVYRSSDLNGKIFLAHDLKNFNWSELYNMTSCEQMLKYFTLCAIASLMTVYHCCVVINIPQINLGLPTPSVHWSNAANPHWKPRTGANTDFIATRLSVYS